MQVRTLLVPSVLIFPNTKVTLFHLPPKQMNMETTQDQRDRLVWEEAPTVYQTWPLYAHGIPKLALYSRKELGHRPPAWDLYLVVCWWLSSQAPWRGTAGWYPVTWSSPLGNSADKTPPAPGRTEGPMLSLLAPPVSDSLTVFHDRRLIPFQGNQDHSQGRRSHYLKPVLLINRSLHNKFTK